MQGSKVHFITDSILGSVMMLSNSKVYTESKEEVTIWKETVMPIQHIHLEGLEKTSVRIDGSPA
jgi:hypothetical protein